MALGKDHEERDKPMKKKYYYPLNLTLFDGEGAAAPAGESITPAAEETKGEAKVIYGKNEEITEEVPVASEQNKVTPDPEARKAEFEKLIQGDFKDLFGERVQDVINKRFKETKTLEKQLNDYKPLVDLLGPKYGVTDGDVSKLAKAIEEDNALWEQEAMDQGLTVDQFKHQMRIQRENDSFRKEREEGEARRAAQETYNGWIQQSNDMKNTYPGFNLDTEIRNPQTGQQFMQVLKATGDVKTAYHAVNFDKILPTAMQATAQKVQEATVNNIQSRKSRPSENGANSSAGVIVKNDPSKWTDNDIDEVIRRVRMGETINL